MKTNMRLHPQAVVFVLSSYLFLLQLSALAKTTFLTRIPNYPEDWPAIGHIHPNDGKGNLSPFGMDFLLAGNHWSTELCLKDSDADGRTNGEELGDPECVWKKGDPRTVVLYKITNPSIHNVFPVDDPFFNRSTTSPRLNSITPSPFSRNEPAESAGISLEPWLVAHVLLGVLSVGILMPLGTAMTSFLRKRNAGYYKELHIAICAFASGLTVATLILPIGVRSGFYQLQSSHSISAIALVSVLSLQSMTGSTVFFFESSCARFINCRIWHIRIARFAAFGLSTVVVMTGYDNLRQELVDQSPSSSVEQGAVLMFGSFHVLAMLIFWLLHELHQFRRRRKYGSDQRKRGPLTYLGLTGQGSQVIDAESQLAQRLRETSANSQVVQMTDVTRDQEDSSAVITRIAAAQLAHAEYSHLQCSSANIDVGSASFQLELQ